MFFAPLQVHVRVIRFHRLLSCPRLCCFFLPESELILCSGVFFFPLFKEILSGVIGRFRCLGSVCFPWVAPSAAFGGGREKPGPRGLRLQWPFHVRSTAFVLQEGVPASHGPASAQARASLQELPLDLATLGLPSGCGSWTQALLCPPQGSPHPSTPLTGGAPGAELRLHRRLFPGWLGRLLPLGGDVLEHVPGRRLCTRQ